MKLRPYQFEAIEAINRELKSHKSTLCILPTGMGKTVIFSHLSDQWQNRSVLVLAHKRELIYQAAEKIRAVTGSDPEIEMGDTHAQATTQRGWWQYGIKRIVVASKDSLHENRIGKFQPNEFGLIVVDEAHRAARHNKTYRRILDYFAEAHVVGFTATADRADKASVIGTVFNSVAYELQLPAAIGDGYLVPLRSKIIKVDGLDFSRVRTRAGDLSAADLEKILTEEKQLHQSVAAIIDIVEQRPTIIFCATKAHANAVATVLNRYTQDRFGADRAVCITDETEDKLRAQQIAEFKAGDWQYLVGCMVFTEGFDAERVSCVAILRPTKSRPLFTQMVGRATRPLDGGRLGDTPDVRRQQIASSAKPESLVLDFVGSTADLKLTVSVADILADAVEMPEGFTDEQKAEAIERAKARQMGEDDPADLPTLIREEALLLEEESIADIVTETEQLAVAEERRKALVASSVTYRVRDTDHFDGPDRSKWDKSESVPFFIPASEKQIKFLVALGCDPETAKKATKRQAGAMINSYKERGVEPDWRRTRLLKA